MKLKVLLLIATCCFWNYQANAGSGLAINKMNSCELNSAVQENSFTGEFSEHAVSSGNKFPERYYIKNTLNVLKRPLYAAVIVSSNTYPS